jgi:hypothetical protein
LSSTGGSTVPSSTALVYLDCAAALSVAVARVLLLSALVAALRLEPTTTSRGSSVSATYLSAIATAKERNIP